MRLEQDQCNAKYQINAYQPGIVTINHAAHTSSLIITQKSLITQWTDQCIDTLSDNCIDTLLTTQADIFILGTGEHFQWPATPVRQKLANMSVAIEYMDTAAACRTFMALLMEGRDVAAGLLIT